MERAPSVSYEKAIGIYELAKQGVKNEAISAVSAVHVKTVQRIVHVFNSLRDGENAPTYAADYMAEYARRYFGKLPTMQTQEETSRDIATAARYKLTQEMLAEQKETNRLLTEICRIWGGVTVKEK